jgi:hypothetical protein
MTTRLQPSVHGHQENNDLFKKWNTGLSKYKGLSNAAQTAKIYYLKTQRNKTVHNKIYFDGL